VATGFTGPHGTIKLLLSENDPPGSAPVALRVAVGPGMGTGTIERLSGDALEATGGVLLAGRAVAAVGSWRPGRLERASTRAGTTSFTLPPSSAALLTVQRAPPLRRHPHR
jgi:hypothetical protein